MKLREFANRTQSGNLIGAICMVPQYGKGELVSFSHETAFFKFVEGSNNVLPVEITGQELLDLEVIKFPEPWLKEGDILYFNENRKEKVIRVKEGDGSPYPIVTEYGQYKWGEFKGVLRGVG